MDMEKQKHYLDRGDVWPVVGIINYRGCLVEKTKWGFKIFGKEVTTPEEVDRIINESLEYLNKSIKKMGYEL
jgi:hypothetical protein